MSLVFCEQIRASSKQQTVLWVKGDTINSRRWKNLKNQRSRRSAWESTDLSFSVSGYRKNTVLLLASVGDVVDVCIKCAPTVVLCHFF